MLSDKIYFGIVTYPMVLRIIACEIISSAYLAFVEKFAFKSQWFHEIYTIKILYSK